MPKSKCFGILCGDIKPYPVFKEELYDTKTKEEFLFPRKNTFDKLKSLISDSTLDIIKRDKDILERY